MESARVRLYVQKERKQMVSEKDIERINFLARKSKNEGLSPSEKDEQQKLRKAYVEAFKANLKSQLDNVEIVDK